jgi:fructoselysine-6-P-deglycase FrlB-like protein
MTNTYQEYRDGLQRAIGQKDAAGWAIAAASRAGVENVFLVGCGGSLAIMLSGKYILEVNSRLPFYVYNSAEFVSLQPKALGAKSLVIVASSSGTTPETIEAARFAKVRGATTVGISRKADAPLTKEVDFLLSAEATTGIADCKLIMLYCLLFHLVKTTDRFARFDDVMRALDVLPDALCEVRNRAEQPAAQFAEDYQRETIFYTLGSGACWGQAYSYAVCILEEMQWLTAQPIHAGEYFHGPFEVVDANANLLLFRGEDLSRPLADRAVRFSEKMTKRMLVIDTKDYALPGVPDDLRGYFSPLVLLAVLDRFSQQLAAKRGHPLTVRRYMGRMPY